jgi:HTH-type transcriptional regulator, transcriptional repressor of NAD biosynthesis genes
MSNAVKPYRLGLVVGKFSPLHRGHEHVISTALAQCDQVLVLGYSQPEFEGCERHRREAWIGQRFPEVINVQLDDTEIERLAKHQGIAPRVIPHNLQPDDIQQAYLVWLLRDLLSLRPDAMYGSEHYVTPCARTLSRHLGHPVQAIEVDLARRDCPISATRIRADVHGERAWLAPEVYKDFVPRIVMLGGESTGKSTLAQAMAAKLGTVWVPEYGRERWEQQGGQLSLADLVAIGREQVRRETAHHLQAHRYLLCDTSPLTTLGYAEWMFNAAPSELMALARRPYDMTVLCGLDLPFVQDGTRRDEAFRSLQHEWFMRKLHELAVPYFIVDGLLHERIARIQDLLDSVARDSIKPL